MVLAGAVLTEDIANELEESGLKDSKLLTPKKRAELCELIKEKASAFDIQVISPGMIDAKEDMGLNLNDLEAKHAAQIIDNLQPDVAILDCPSNNIPAWTEKVKEFLNHKCELIVEHKGERHMPVAAGAILAKCTRDAEVEEIQKLVPVPIGSGYPSDPVTKEFIKEYHDKYPDIFRKSWTTYQNVIDSKNQKSLEDF